MTLLRRLPRMRKMPSERPPSSKRAPTAAEVAYLGFSATWWHAHSQTHLRVTCDGTFIGIFDAEYISANGDAVSVDAKSRCPQGVLVQLLMKLREKG